MSQNTLNIQITLEPGAHAPVYGRPGDAGADLTSTHAVTLGPGQHAAVGTGVAVAVPVGHALFIHPRSGLAAKQGITVLNAPGTVDAGYRGEVKVLLLNTSQQPVTLPAGTRIAQAVVQKVEQVNWEIVESLDQTERGAGGFGSTGV